MEQLDQFVKSIDHWLGAIAFLATIFTSVKVYLLDKSVQLSNQKHLLHSRIADYITNLNNILLKIADFNSLFEEKKRKIKEQVKISEEIVKNIQKKRPKDSKCKELIAEAKKIEKKVGLTAEIVDNYYIQVRGFIVHLEELKKDNENSLPL